MHVCAHCTSRKMIDLVLWVCVSVYQVPWNAHRIHAVGANPFLKKLGSSFIALRSG